MPGAAVPVLIVRDDPEPAVMLVGLTFAVAPAGTPETDSDTVPATPDVTAVAMLAVPLAPWTRPRLVGVAANEKLLTTGPLRTQLFC